MPNPIWQTNDGLVALYPQGEVEGGIPCAYYDPFAANSVGYVAEWCRVMRPNGLLFVFVSPKLVKRISVHVSEHLHVVNTATWVDGKRDDSEILQAFSPSADQIVFEDPYERGQASRADRVAARASELKTGIFGPLRLYLRSEWKRAGLTTKNANVACDMKSAAHFFNGKHWVMPTWFRYSELRNYAKNVKGVSILKREHSELEMEYGKLKHEFKGLMREYRSLALTCDPLDYAAMDTRWAPSTQSCGMSLQVEGLVGGGLTGFAVIQVGGKHIEMVVNKRGFDVITPQISEGLDVLSTEKGVR